MEEFWKPVKVRGEDFTGYYEVSNLGRIKKIPTRSCDGKRFLKERIMKQTLDKKGYLTVNLQKESSRFTRIFVHRIVAEAFIPNPNNFPQVGHKDDTILKTNNCVENLYWTTNKENANTEGRKQRLSMSHMGAKNHGARAVICEGITFPTMSDCAKHYNTFVQEICAWLNGRKKMPEVWIQRGLKRVD